MNDEEKKNLGKNAHENCIGKIVLMCDEKCVVFNWDSWMFFFPPSSAFIFIYTTSFPFIVNIYVELRYRNAFNVLSVEKLN